MEPYSILSVWFNGNRVEITVEDMNEGKVFKVSLTGVGLMELINSKDIDHILIADKDLLLEKCDDYKGYFGVKT